MQNTRGTPLTDAGPGHDTPGGSARPYVRALLLIAGVVWLFDQITKIVAVDRLTGRDPIELAGGLLTLRLVRNPGAAFGLAGGATVVFSLVAVVVVVAILRTARRLRSGGWALALGLVLGGAVGNLTDRLLRDPAPLRGHVVDFLELPNWPVFNLADSAICVGAGVVVLMTARGRHLDGTVEGAATGPHGDESVAHLPAPEASTDTQTAGPAGQLASARPATQEPATRERGTGDMTADRTKPDDEPSAHRAPVVTDEDTDTDTGSGTDTDPRSGRRG